METALVRVQPEAGAVGPLAPVEAAAREYIRQAKAANTVRAYDSDWKHFTAWCEEHGRQALPAAPGTVALYLSALAGTHKASSITRRLSAISQAHQMAGGEAPAAAAEVRTVLAGIRRAKGTAPRTKAPTLTDDIRRMVAALPAGLLGVRDRALLLLGFAGAFRRSELVGLDVSDLEFTTEGLVVSLRHSKTDQEGAGRKVGIPLGSNPGTCPVHALRDWLKVSGIAEGPVFRCVNRHGHVQLGRLSGYAVALVVKRRASAVDLDAARYAGHSLRAGLATSAAIAGASERSIMAQTGHRSVGMVRRYIRDGSLFRENAAARAGL
ncbi:MAG: site-specific integrase [Bryobacteraceae bacterium]